MYRRTGKDHEKRFIAVCLAAAACVLLSTNDTHSHAAAEYVYRKYCGFDVLANSDSQADQALNSAVREPCRNHDGRKIAKCRFTGRSTDAVTENLQEIETCAANVIRENGYDYPVHGRWKPVHFRKKLR